MSTFWRSYAAGLAVPFAALAFRLMTGMTPGVGIVVLLLLAAGAVTVGKSFAGVAAGLATVFLVAAGGLYVILANADF